jgi:serine/threonine protein phosphatase PrpC
LQVRNHHCTLLHSTLFHLPPTNARSNFHHRSHIHLAREVHELGGRQEVGTAAVTCVLKIEGERGIRLSAANVGDSRAVRRGKAGNI